MKDTLLTGIWLIVWYAVFLCLFSLAAVLPEFAMKPSSETAGTGFISFLPASAQKAHAPAVFLALFFILYRLSKKEGIRVFSLLLCFGISFGLLSYGFVLLAGPRSGSGAPHSLLRLSPGFLYRTENGTMYVLAETENRVDGYFSTPQNPEFARDAAANISLTEAGPIVSSASGILKFPSSDPGRAGYASRDPVSDRLEEILGSLSVMFAVSETPRDSLNLAAAAFTLFIVSCWGFTRMKSWPLAGGILSVFFLGLVFFIPWLTVSGPAASLFPDRGAVLTAVSGGFGGLGIAFFLFDVFLVPYPKKASGSGRKPKGRKA